MNQELAKIRDYQKKASLRKKDGVFVVEGIRACREVPEERLLRTVVSESYVKAYGKPEGALVVPDRDFERVSDTKTPQGILKLASVSEPDEDTVLEKENGLYMLLENVRDPGNLGTIIRTAEACCVDAVILSPECVDLYNPKVVRATMGSLFRVSCLVSGDLKKTVEKIRKRGGKVYAASLQDSVSYDDADYCGMSAFIIGNEANGLTEEICEASDMRIHIPMGGEVESLNASVAAAVLMAEAARQRRKKG